MSTEITNYFEIDRGLTVVSSGGMRKFTEAIDSYSQLYSSVATNSGASKHCIDSCWESGNIYFIDSDNYVRKIAFDGTVLASLKLTNPVAVSAIQYSNSMQTNITYPPQDDKGCWIADNGTGKVIKTDKNLNIEKEYSGLPGAFCLESGNDGGCFIAERRFVGGSYLGSILKIDSEANLEASKAFSDFSTAIENIDRMVIDINSRLSVLGEDVLFNFDINSDGIFVEYFAVDILGSGDPFSSSSSENLNEQMHVSDIDIDRNSGVRQYIYVTGGNSSRAFVLRYNVGNASSPNLEKTYYDIEFPYIIQVVQGIESSSLYLLSDIYKWDEYGYGSSSSSSSSTSSSSSI